MTPELRLPSPVQMAAARAMLGLTQIELSARANVAFTTIKRMEAARASPAEFPSIRLSSLQRLLSYYHGAGIEFLFGPDSAGISLKKG
jgi:predicted transcriptional regulator